MNKSPVGYIIFISVGLSALLVSTIWAMREPFYRGTSDRTSSTFFVSVCLNFGIVLGHLGVDDNIRLTKDIV